MRRNSLNYVLFSFTLDLTGTAVALFLAQQLRVILPFRSLPLQIVQLPLSVFILTLIIWSVIAFTLSIYDPLRNHRLINELQHVFIATLFSMLVLAGTLYFTYREISRLQVIYFYILDLFFLYGWRIIIWLLRLSRGRTYDIHRVIILGANELGKQVSETLHKQAWMGLKFVGFLDDNTPNSADLPILGTLDNVLQIIEAYEIEEIIVALPYREYDKLNQLVGDTLPLPVKIRIVPNFLNLALHQATVEEFGSLPLINLRDIALTKYQLLTKRAFDLIISSILLFVSLPIMIAVAVAIKLDSPGPIIFKQRRVGENGGIFTMYKFRSMCVGAEARQNEVVQYDEMGNVTYKVLGDPRVTRVGRFIRRTSLDELPQLLNVLNGEMTLVGPRPEMPWLVEKYEPWQRKRFTVPPGLTGWWQINGRSDKPMHLHTEDDLYYIQNYSLLLDMYILWKTIPTIVKRRGAF
jgi:exopolysaccharide biosynthesis polyprenyl glycosylphosphotransferase